MPQQHGADSWKYIDKQYSEQGPKSAQKCCCLKMTWICAENSWQWIWFSLLLKLMNFSRLHWVQGAWQASTEWQKPLLVQTAYKGFCQLHNLPSEGLCSKQKVVVLSRCSALHNSKLCVCRLSCLQYVNMCSKHTLTAFYIFKFCLKTLGSPWIFYCHHEESILHLHFYAGTYIFKTNSLCALWTW